MVTEWLPLAINRSLLIMQHLDYKNGRAVFCTWSDVTSKGKDRLIGSSLRKSVKRGLGPEAEE
jgi:hypothetical protein